MVLRFDVPLIKKGGGGACSFVVCLHRMAIDHASLSRSGGGEEDSILTPSNSGTTLLCHESRLIIKERDDILSESIIKACREHPGRPVVAVLGLLHCNGVADNLRRYYSTAPE